MTQMRVGSTKVMTPVEPGVIAITHRDTWSVFDRGSSPQEIPSLGIVRCACAVQSFRLLTEAGVDHHFIKQVDDRTIHVREFHIPGHVSLSGQCDGEVLPVEWIYRYAVHGSLLERIQQGIINPVSLGFRKGSIVEEGTKLPKVLLECTTKFEPTDRHLSDDEARNICGLDPSQWKVALSLLQKAVEVTSVGYKEAGYQVPDGKGELVRFWSGKIIIADVFATQDESRIVGIDDGKLYCKDILRNYFKKHHPEWYAELKRAQNEHPTDPSKWPPYPKVPSELLDLVASRYSQVARDYAGVNTK